MTPTGFSPLNRFAWLTVFSIGLMIIDHRSSYLHPVRIATSVISIPFETAVSLPATLSGVFEQYYPDSSLHDELEALRRKQSVLEARLQRYETLEQENERLATLLSASRRNTDDVLLSEIVDFGLEPFSQKIIVNRGVESGVYVGQPAIAPQGVLGQVSRTGFRRSVITLVTDSSHGLPVQVERNGLRTIIHGTGKQDRVRVPYLDAQADIRKGDILVTSGMGGRFPVGYKVAEVTDVVKDATEAFLDITAVTTAKLGFTKEVLLLWSSDIVGNPRPPHAEEEDEE